MRLIMLLVALVIVALLVGRQMNNSVQPNVEGSMAPADSGVPKVPVRPQGVEQFEKDMNKFMEDEASEQAKKLKQITQ